MGYFLQPQNCCRDLARKSYKRPAISKRNDSKLKYAKNRNPWFSYRYWTNNNDNRHNGLYDKNLTINSKEMAVLLKCIIDLSSTLDILSNKSNPSEEEAIAFNNTKKVFARLCELELTGNDVIADLYHNSGISKELYTR